MDFPKPHEGMKGDSIDTNDWHDKRAARGGKGNHQGGGGKLFAPLQIFTSLSNWGKRMETRGMIEKISCQRCPRNTND